MYTNMADTVAPYHILAEPQAIWHTIDTAHGQHMGHYLTGFHLIS